MTALIASGGGYWLISNIVQTNQQTETMAIAIRNHVEGDMMHDAIRASIFKAEIARLTGNSALSREAYNDRERYSIWYERVLRANEALDLPAREKQALAKLRPPLSAYIEQANITMAMINGDAPGREKHMVRFTEKFDELEASQEKMSDVLEAKATQLRTGAQKRGQITILGFLTLSMMVIAAIFWAYRMTMRRLIKPLEQQTEALNALARGEAVEAVSYADRADELGRLATGIEAFRANMEAMRGAAEAVAAADKEAAQASAEKAEAIASADADRRRIQDEIARSMENRVLSAVRNIVSSGESIKQMAAGFAGSSQQTMEQLLAVSSSGAQMVGNTEEVAAATAQLADSADEFVRLMQGSLERLQNADDAGRVATERAAELSQLTDQVEAMSLGIAKIATQTNQLALNATIEAGRAGEAGKGFAIVAAEVKVLATQTAQATTTISALLTAIRNTTATVDGAIQQTAASISELKQASSIVAQTAEEQTQATSEIERNIRQVAAGTRQLDESVATVRSFAESSSEGATHLSDTATALDALADGLQSELTGLIKEIRAA